MGDALEKVTALLLHDKVSLFACDVDQIVVPNYKD
jgi:hypothetical protein